jgi:hypothetical protein
MTSPQLIARWFVIAGMSVASATASSAQDRSIDQGIAPSLAAERARLDALVEQLAQARGTVTVARPNQRLNEAGTDPDPDDSLAFPLDVTARTARRVPRAAARLGFNFNTFTVNWASPSTVSAQNDRGAEQSLGTRVMEGVKATGRLRSPTSAGNRPSSRLTSIHVIPTRALASSNIA